MGLAKNKHIKNIRPDRTILTELPKIEIHRHLEGSYPIESLFKMATRNELDVPGTLPEFKEAFQFPKDHESDFLLFLSKFKKFWYKTMEDISSIAYDSVLSFTEDNLHYIELRFNPLHFTELTGFDPREVTKTIINACDVAAAEINLDIRYLLTFNRGIQNSAEMIKTFKSLHDVDLSRVVGIDLAGDEINFPPELFVEFFDLIAKEDRFGIDIHAGEIGDSKNMWTAIDQLHATRIGHGVASINDFAMQKLLKDKKIFLGQCITSNYQTAAWSNEATHPMKELYEAGVPINISSDDPTIQDTILTDDYEKTVKNFGWTVEDLIESNIKSVDACFLSNREKAGLKASYINAVNVFKAKFGL